jgi:uracil permease
VLQVGTVSMTGIGLSAVIGVLLNLILPRTKTEKEADNNANRQ